MNRCVREAELEAALDGRLDADTMRCVLTHAKGCLRCREAKAELELLRASVRQLEATPNDTMRLRRVRASIMTRALVGGDAAPRRSTKTMLAVAATLVVALGSAWSARRITARTPPSLPASASEDPRRIDLRDVGSLWPADDARVLVRSVGVDTRIELSQGEVTFQVNHRRANERFVVHLDDAEVEVHGTRFTVVAERGRLRRVQVLEGVVAVRHAGDAERTLAAGAHLILPLRVAEAPDASRVEPGSAEGELPAAVTPRPSAPDPGAWFRAGSLAYARGEHGTVERELARFLAASSRGDARREDARYLRVLSLRALGRTDGVLREAEAYGREFPQGARRPEVVLTVVTALAAAGRCDEARAAARTMPAGAPARLQHAMERAAQCTGATP